MSLGLPPVCLFRLGQEVGHCESLNSLPQEPVHICEFLQFYSSAHLLLLTLTFYRILSWCPLLGVNTDQRKKERKKESSADFTKFPLQRSRVWPQIRIDNIAEKRGHKQIKVFEN